MKLKLNGKKRNGNGNGHNGNGNGHGGSSLLKVVLLVAAVLLVGVLLFRQAQRISGPKVELWVASTNLPAGAIVTSDDLAPATLRASDLPEGTLAERAAIEGQQVVRPVAEGAPFLSTDVRPPARAEQRSGASMAELMPEGRVVSPVLVAIENVVLYELQFGDRFDLLSSGRDGASVIASDVFFFAWVNPDEMNPQGNGNGGNGGERGGGLLSDLLSMPPRAGGSSASGIGGVSKLLLALHPTDVLAVAEAQASGPLSIVLHGKTEVESGRLLELGRGRAADVDLITGSKRESVPVS